MTRGKAQGLRVAGDPEQVSESQWLQLISLRESEHPADVLGPLSRLIELGVEQAGDKYRYAKAVKALRRLREDYERGGATPPAHVAARPDCNGDGRFRASFATTCRARPAYSSSSRSAHTLSVSLMTCSAGGLIATGMRRSAGSVTRRHYVIAGQAECQFGLVRGTGCGRISAWLRETPYVSRVRFTGGGVEQRTGGTSDGTSAHGPHAEGDRSRARAEARGRDAYHQDDRGTGPKTRGAGGGLLGDRALV